MEILNENLSKIKIAKPYDKVYKDECVFSFDNPETETGLYVSLINFIGLGHDYLETYYKRTGVAIYLHIRRLKHEVPKTTQGDGPEKKITRLAIGVDGGFNPDTNDYEYEDVYEIVCMPGFKTIPWPNDEIPIIVKESIQSILDITSATKMAQLEALNSTWDGETRIVSKFANNLLQLENDKKIPPSGWKCEKCDKTENLWLNLTDGSILCGRKFFDGSGGNNHAVEHYQLTGYPLAVKLGTITKEGKGDVFSYKEDDMVENPHLIQHLAHWGINIANMEKTEKSILELELELNQKNEWATITESSGKLQPLYGPGYTGITNMGNSCYLNSVMQMLFVIPNFIKHYYKNAEKIMFDKLTINSDPANDFNIQMAKLGVGLLSGKYSTPIEIPKFIVPSGIRPLMLSLIIGKGHPEFSTKRQQDVQEFFLHLLTLLERYNKNHENPGDCFKFLVEERFQCNASKMVKYITRSDVMLSLTIPMEAAINKEEVAAYETKKQEAEKENRRLDNSTIVRPKINFFSCLEMYSQSEIINNFYSSAVNQNVSAKKSTKLASFPDYLVIQLKKFMLREDWVAIKLDVSIDIPDILDITSLRGSGPQVNEEILPEPEIQPPAPIMDENVLKQLVDMGFPLEACKRAIFFTGNHGLETAMQWIMEHITDSDFSDRFIPPGTEQQFVPNTEALASIIDMGFTHNQAIKALKQTDNNVERAMDWIFSHSDDLNIDDDTFSGGAVGTSQSINGSASCTSQSTIKDGNGKYKLKAFISHMGTSTMAGHYVIHLLKDDRWIIFNDEKVALSENPPKDLGYMYLYERL